MEEAKAIYQHFNAYVQHWDVCDALVKRGYSKVRHPNFPEHVSEGIVKHIINRFEGIYARDAKRGDLVITNDRVEVKAFASTGPISFGPTEAWSVLYILDCTQFREQIFTCHKINLANDSAPWVNIKVNQQSTFADQCAQKRRPRLVFDTLKYQIPEFIHTVFTGYLHDIIF